MTPTAEIMAKVQKLPPEKQQQVLEYVESLHEEPPLQTPRPNLYGLWRNYGPDITEEDMAEARREMWGNVPRKDV